MGTGNGSWRQMDMEGLLKEVALRLRSGGREERLQSLLEEGRAVQRPRGGQECGIFEAQRKKPVRLQ